ncbi:MAG: hypothetical protein HDS66_02755 [Bacteroidales bacterium]|nr:hypothetical protein [Bacteroidales bacterium]
MRKILTGILMCSVALISSAAELTDSVKTNESVIQQSGDDTLLGNRGRSLIGSHFTWGADVGSSVDLSGSDMTTFDIDAYFGYKGSLIRTAAVGAGVHKAFGNSYTFIPVYALLRTSFRSEPSLLFFELKGGYSFNTLADSGSAGGAYGSLGVGFNLAMSKKLQSHIVLSYGFFTLRHASELAIPYVGDNISYAILHFGVNF